MHFRDYKGEMVNRFGERFSITTFGESHGKAMGVHYRMEFQARF